MDLLPTAPNIWHIILVLRMTFNNASPKVLFVMKLFENISRLEEVGVHP